MNERSAFGYVAAIIGGLTGAIDPILGALLILIACDVITGVLAAYVQRRVTSEATYRGGAKKTIILFIVVAGEWVGSAVSLGFDLGAALAAYYCVHEAISILENAAAVGIPLPSGLLDALKKAQELKR